MTAIAFIPYDYQQRAIDLIQSHKNYGLFLDMGLGKSICALTAAVDLIYDQFSIRKVLVIAPKKVAQSTWKQEGIKWEHTKQLRMITVMGTEEHRRKALLLDADIYIINRENVEWLVKHYGYKLPFDMLIVDESSSFKNPKAKRFKALRKVRTCFDRILILTGTPAPRSIEDIWAQIYLLDGGERLGKTMAEFHRQYFTPGLGSGHIVYRYDPIQGAKKMIYDKIADICISMKSEDYLTLPEIMTNTISVDIGTAAMKKYREFTKNKILSLGGHEITAEFAASLSGKQLQMANGAVYDDNAEMTHLHDAKLEALAEIAETQEGKSILVFYTYRHDLVRLMKYFPKAVKLSNNDDITAWNDGRVPMLLAHPASAGYGLNLQQGGHIVVWFGLTWDLELYQQANKRLHRQGQKYPVIIHHLVARGTMDEQVLPALERKACGQDALLDAIKLQICEFGGE